MMMMMRIMMTREVSSTATMSIICRETRQQAVSNAYKSVLSNVFGKRDRRERERESKRV